MLVIMVKLGKVIEYKKQIIQNITSMNDYAEKFNLLTNEYPKEFQVMCFLNNYNLKLFL